MDEYIIADFLKIKTQPLKEFIVKYIADSATKINDFFAS